MSEDLSNEIQAINSIYFPNTILPSPPNPLTSSSTTGPQTTHILTLPDVNISLRLYVPADYPASPPAVLGTDHVGEDVSKGEGARIVEILRHVLGKTWREGEVCMFEVLEEVGDILKEDVPEGIIEDDVKESPTKGPQTSTNNADSHDQSPTSGTPSLGATPPWTLSTTITEKKSVFLARAAPVSSPTQAKIYIHHLLSTDKKVAKATHNITAWRIRGDTNTNTLFQDCDDDGETAAGGRVLHLMQIMDLWGVVVVVTRWYGGVQLGPDRFRIINTVARDAFIKGGFVRAQDSGDGGRKKEKKRKDG